MTQLLNQLVLEKGKANLDAFSATSEAFEKIKNSLLKKEMELKKAASIFDPRIVIELEDKGRLELHFKAGNDVLVFIMHAGIFQLDPSHIFYKTAYVKENPLRGYCGIICIYNFMADSFRYNRKDDMGILVSRIMVNHEGHFFMDGKKQLGIIYNKLDTDLATAEAMDSIVEANLLYCADADFYIPPLASMSETTVEALTNRSLITTDPARRFGFYANKPQDDIQDKK